MRFIFPLADGGFSISITQPFVAFKVITLVFLCCIVLYNIEVQNSDMIIQRNQSHQVVLVWMSRYESSDVFVGSLLINLFQDPILVIV